MFPIAQLDVGELEYYQLFQDDQIHDECVPPKRALKPRERQLLG